MSLKPAAGPMGAGEGLRKRQSLRGSGSYDKQGHLPMMFVLGAATQVDSHTYPPRMTTHCPLEAVSLKRFLAQWARGAFPGQGRG